MEKYELFLKELTELCRKHDIEISVDCHSVELSLFCASDFKKTFPDFSTIHDKEYTFVGDGLNFEIAS